MLQPELRIHTFNELLILASSLGSTRDFSVLHARPYFLFSAPDCPIHSAQCTLVIAWLQQLSCPSICIASTRYLLDVCQAADAIVANDSEALVLINTIQKSPVAASIFTQLLRSTEDLPLTEALVMESLAYATLQAGAEFKNWLQQQTPSATSISVDDPAVQLARHDDTLHIGLNRPKNHNAITTEMRDALGEAFALLQADESITHAKIFGHGQCFSVGGDLAEFGSTPNPAIGHLIRNLTLPARLLLPVAQRTEFHLHGACIGAGIELPAFAPRITADKDTFFQLPELKFGLIPGAGGTVSIPRRIGRHRTAWMVLSGKRINAKKALEWGLIDHIT